MAEFTHLLWVRFSVAWSQNVSCKLSSLRLLNAYPPLQLGVGVPGGSESIIHAVNLHLSSNIPTSDKPTLLIDFANTFNSIDRSSMFSCIHQHLPSLSAWFESCYGSAPILYYRDRSLARAAQASSKATPLVS